MGAGYDKLAWCCGVIVCGVGVDSIGTEGRELKPIHSRIIRICFRDGDDWAGVWPKDRTSTGNLVKTARKQLNRSL